MRKLYLIFIFCIFSSYTVQAVEGLLFENITTRNGLSQNTIRCMMQDSRGFMWIGTLNGLNRYDGREFTVMLPHYGSLSLSENRIRYIVEDKRGYLWIQSNSDIINCYDTHLDVFVDYTHTKEPKAYKSILFTKGGDVWLWGVQDGCCRVQYTNGVPQSTFLDKDNIGTNSIAFVFEDSNQTIWMGTNDGLFRFTDGKIKPFQTGKDTYNYHSVIEKGKYIYFFTNNNKIVVFDKSKKTGFYTIPVSKTYSNLKLNNTAVLDEEKILITTLQEIFIFDINLPAILPADNFFDRHLLKNAHILVDNRNEVWVYNKNGNMWHYRKKLEKFTEYRLIPENILRQLDLERFAVLHDSRDIIWITTYGNGLFALEPETSTVSHFTRANSELKSDYLLSITEDKSGEIWVGTEYAGIMKISLPNYKNVVFYPDKNKSDNAAKTIRTIYEDRTGDIWIGTKGGSIYVVDKDLKDKRKIDLAVGMPYTLNEDTLGNKWVGTKGSGLVIYPADVKKSPEIYTNDLSDNQSITNNNLYAILRDTKGRMWLGTFGSGILLCERNNGKLMFRKIPSISTLQTYIRCLFQDSKGLIWVGGNNGVSIFDPDKLLQDALAFTNLHFDAANPNSISNDEVKTIFEDSSGRIWIGTSGGGLNLVVREEPLKNTRFKHYSSQQGLINDVVQAILEDNEKKLWISTESGISRLNAETDIFENYSFSNNWENNLFCESSCFKRKNGELMFGSYDGMYIFNSAAFNNHSYIPPVTVTNFKINGNLVTPNTTGSPLKVSITETKTIQLKNEQNSFSIEFSSLSFQNSYSNGYTYILEGFEKDWNPITRYNVATYRNIPVGKYIFKVKGCNSYGVWNETITELEIIVTPPFWKSSLAIALYIVLLLATGFFTFKLIIRMNSLNNAVKVEKQLTDYRLQFFTNISHEFRTPLTIIRGSIEGLNAIENLPDTIVKYLKTLDKSSVRLMRLIDQLLEFRRLQNNKMELNLEKTEAVDFFKDIFHVFKETAEKKKITFTFTTNEDSQTMLLDRGKMDKIAYNLLSNAFKYTPEGGKINLDIVFDTEKDTFRLSVSDSGIGIPKEKQATLFTRFMQVNYSSSGTGIGLHLTSELTGVLKGNIQYSDSKLGGACFTVTVPLSDKVYDTDARLTIPDQLVQPNNFELDESENSLDNGLKRKKVLIIEDDEEVREFIKDQLSEIFTVTTAENGLTGLEKANKEQPNLVVCDVMMPELDGFEVTRRLKNEFQTSHIPIILLTAHSSSEHQLEGVEAGTDAYITKPFSVKYLITRIVKLMEQRDKLQQRYAKEPGLLQPAIYATNKDKEFLDKVHQIIEQNIDNPDFNVEQFAQSVKMGRTVFYKKTKGITGYSPSEYLKLMRMKKAAELLATTNLNVSEVSYKIGINDPFYFSKCFKAQFGKTPSQFQKGG